LSRLISPGPRDGAVGGIDQGGISRDVPGGPTKGPIAKPADTESSFAPFRDRAFALLWVATVVSNIAPALWGEVAALSGIPEALAVAAAGALTAILLLWRWKLNIGGDLDLAPSLHWPDPVPSADVAADRRPVLVTVEYQIKPADRVGSWMALRRSRAERRRDGPFAWEIYVAAGLVRRDCRPRTARVNRYQVDGAPKVTHLIAASEG
jgi:hypothetical protein